MKKLSLLVGILLSVSFYGQTIPNLASAKTFGILSGSSITATDTITVSGNAGATTSVSGRIKATTVYTGGTTVSTALTDLGSAKTNCSGQSATSISGALGGQTLVHGVYSISGNATINDTLKLTGDTSSVFIFNITGNLTVDTLSIIMKGTIMPSKIFWNVGGTVTLKHYSNIFGMILSTGTINMYGIFSGRICVLSQAGINFNNQQSLLAPGIYYGYNVSSSLKMTILDWSLPCTASLTSCNLVSNPSFETVDICPTEGVLYHACEWGAYQDYTHSPDFANICSLFTTCDDASGTGEYGVYNNLFGSQTPHTPSNYGGFGAYMHYPSIGFLTNVKVWNWFPKDLGTPISSPAVPYLTVGLPYYFECYVSLSNNSDVSAPIQVYCVNNVADIAFPGGPAPSFTAPVITTAGVWTKIAGCVTPTLASSHEIVLKVDATTPGSYTLITPSNPLTHHPWPFGSNIPDHYAYYYTEDWSTRKLADAGPDYAYNCLNTNYIGVNCSPIAGATYSWTGDAFAIAHATILNPTSPYSEIACTAAGTYTFSLTVTFGTCSYTDIVVVTSTFAGCTGTPIIGTTTYSAGGTIGTAGTIVAGDLTVTGGTLLINSSDVSFLANKTITIKNGATLTITGAWLHGCTSCGNMWGGIKVEKGGTLVINGGSLIEDATTAVTTLTTGGSGNAAYQISNSIFNKNDNCIRLQSTTANTNTILNTIFDCRTLPTPSGSFTTYFNTIHTALATNTAASLAPYPTTVTHTGTRTVKGVEFLLVTNGTSIVKMGSGTGGTGDMNFFDNLDYGIYVTGTYIDIKNNRFQNISGFQAGSFPPSPPLGIGIYAPAQSFYTNNYMAVGVDVVSTDKNYFYDVFRGIEVNNYWEIHVNDNLFSCSSTPASPSGYTIANIAVYTKDIKENIEIKNNDMTNWINGVYITRNTVTGATLNPPIDVNGNRINANGTGYCGQAVRLSDIVANTITTIFPIYIRNNTINDVNSGIMATNIKNNVVIYNNPNVGLRYSATGATSGISVQSCDKAEIKNNVVHSLVTTYGTGNWDLRGIYVKTSTNNKVFCNTLYSLGQCMVYEGNCLSTTNSTYSGTTNGILGNTMDNARTGLMLRSSGVIGQQGTSTFASSNSWNNAFTFGAGRTYTYTSSTANSASKLYCINTATYFPPTATNMTNVSTQEYALGGLNIATGSAITCPSIYVPPGLMVHNSNIKSMDAGEEAYSEELKGLLINAIAGDTIFSSSEWMMQKFIYDEVKEHSGLQADSLLNAFYTANQTTSFGLIHEVNDSIETGNYAAAVSTNNNINPTNIIEQNQQTFNTIYLAHRDSAAIYTSTDSLNLYNIASQCATEGGNAVFQSRNLLMFIENNVIDFVDNCDVSVESSSRAMEIIAEDKHAIKLYPNPNNGNMTLECNLKDNESGVLFIYDLTGKLMTKYNLTNGTKSLSIDAKILNPATYVYEIIVNGKAIKKDKLTIIK